MKHYCRISVHARIRCILFAGLVIAFLVWHRVWTRTSIQSFEQASRANQTHRTEHQSLDQTTDQLIFSCPLGHVREMQTGICECASSNLLCSRITLPRCVYATHNFTCNELVLGRNNNKLPLPTCDCALQCLGFLLDYHCYGDYGGKENFAALSSILCIAAQSVQEMNNEIRLGRWTARETHDIYKDGLAVTTENTLELAVPRDCSIGGSGLAFANVVSVAVSSPRLQSTIAPIGACPGNCSSRGICMIESDVPTCVCDSIWQGPACLDVSFSFPCPANCWGDHGTCVHGICECAGDFGGIDCRFARVSPTATLSAPLYSSSSNTFFIYDIPHPWSVAWRVWHHRSDVIDFGRKTPVVFLEQALVSPLRVASPENASFFLIPVAGSNTFSRLDALYFIQTRWPSHWQRASGRDHVWLPMVHDTGQSVYWGSPSWRWSARQVTAPENTTRLVMMGLKEGFSTGRHRGSFRVGRDLVIPPFPKQPFTRSPPQSWVPIADRQTLFFFSGKIDRSWRLGNSRLAVFEEAALWNDTRIQIVNGYVNDDVGMMRSSQFCLAPAGVEGGWGFRCSMAVLSGCIPVVLQDNRVGEWQVLGAQKNGSFVILAEADIHTRLRNALVDLTVEQRQAAQRGLAEMYPYYAWAGTTVVDTVFMALART